MSGISVAQRRALVYALADAGPADGGRPGVPGPARATWLRLQACGLVDPTHPIPCACPPAVTPAGLAAMGLPSSVRDTAEAVRAAVRCILPWRRPVVRMRGRLPAISVDDVDDEAAPPRQVCAAEDVVAVVSAEPERPWEQGARCADTVWDAVVAWCAGVGVHLDVCLRAGWRVLSIEPPPDQSGCTAHGRDEAIVAASSDAWRAPGRPKRPAQPSADRRRRAGRAQIEVVRLCTHDQ